MSETINDSNNEKVEQITKIPAIPLKKIKDPKKVAAGKKLADYNRRAKRKQKEVKENQPAISEENNESNDWFPKTTVTTMIALVGLGFTAFDLFLRYKNQTATGEKTETGFTAVETFVPPPVKPNPTLQYGME